MITVKAVVKKLLAIVDKLEMAQLYNTIIIGKAALAHQHPPIKVKPAPPGKFHLSKKQISILKKAGFKHHGRIKATPPFLKVEPGAYRANPRTRPLNPADFGNA